MSDIVSTFLKVKAILFCQVIFWLFYEFVANWVVSKSLIPEDLKTIKKIMKYIRV